MQMKTIFTGFNSRSYFHQFAISKVYAWVFVEVCIISQFWIQQVWVSVFIYTCIMIISATLNYCHLKHWHGFLKNPKNILNAFHMAFVPTVWDYFICNSLFSTLWVHPVVLLALQWWDPIVPMQRPFYISGPPVRSIIRSCCKAGPRSLMAVQDVFVGGCHFRATSNWYWVFAQ